MKYTTKVYANGIVTRLFNKRIVVSEYNGNILITTIFTEKRGEDSNPTNVRLGLELHIQHLHLKKSTAKIVMQSLNIMFPTNF